MPGSPPLIDRERLMADLRALAAIGGRGKGAHRPAFSTDDVRAREWVADRMAAAGLDVAIDGIGNVVGRSPAVERSVLLGSHTDTVPGGGWLDGALGVVAGLEVARTVGPGIDVIDFADEEGTFRGTLGSQVFCGELGSDDLAGISSGSGERLVEAIARSGWAGRELARLDPGRHTGFLELHIEQGPRLEAAGNRLAVVPSIVGIFRLQAVFRGRADHAGTTPPDLRRDAGAAAIRFAGAALDALAELAGPHTVWNVGRIRFEPGASNIVPERAELTIEWRDRELDALVQVERVIAELGTSVAARLGVSYEGTMLSEKPPVLMDERLLAALTAAAAAHGVEAARLPSGAGHDAMVVGHVIPAAMLFVPSIGGRSHHESEDTLEDDLVLGVQVLATAAAQLVIGLRAPASPRPAG